MYVSQLVLANKQLLLLNMKAKIITLINDLWIIPDLAALSAEHLQKKETFPSFCPHPQNIKKKIFNHFCTPKLSSSLDLYTNKVEGLKYKKWDFLAQKMSKKNKKVSKKEEMKTFWFRNVSVSYWNITSVPLHFSLVEY